MKFQRQFLGWFADKCVSQWFEFAFACRALPKTRIFFFCSNMGENDPRRNNLKCRHILKEAVGTKWMSTRKNQSSNQSPHSDCWGGAREISNCAHTFSRMTVHSDSAQEWHAQIDNHSVAASLIHGESIHVLQALLCAQKPAAALHPFFLQQKNVSPRAKLSTKQGPIVYTDNAQCFTCFVCFFPDHQSYIHF